MRCQKIIGCLSIFILATAALADDSTNSVALTDTPTAVQKTISTQTGDGQLGEIDKSTRNGTTVFDVDLTAKDGQSRDFTVDEDGTLLSAEVTLTETPATVQDSIRTLVGQGKLESVDKNLDDVDVTYDVALISADGKEKNFSLTDSGELLSEEVALTETPDVVQKAISSRIGSGKLASIDKTFDDDATNFDVIAISSSSKADNFTIASDGNLRSEELTLSELPPRAQKTIKEKIGDGKILRIDKPYVKRMGVFPFEVEGRKDGKPFDFSVGPHGRFFGMDD